MRTTYGARGVILNREGKIAVVNQRGGAWVLPGGHHERGEDKIATAKREIYEETGLKKAIFVKELGTYKRQKMDCESIDDKKEMKIMSIFLFKTDETKLESHDKDNPKARWVSLDDVARVLTHPKDKAFFRKIKKEIKL